MNEKDLLRAYGAVTKPEYAFGTITDPKPQPGQSKCVVDNCPTMIEDWTGRVMCRYHVGKRKRGEL